MKHIIWDWNGTLLNDLPVIIDAVNETVEQVGIRRITLDDYRTYYTRPVKLFYDEIAGREIDRDEWERIDRMFHETCLSTGRVSRREPARSWPRSSEAHTANRCFRWHRIQSFGLLCTCSMWLNSFRSCKEMRGHLAVSRPSTLPIISPVSTRIGRC